MQERVTGNLRTLLKDYNKTWDGPSYWSSTRSCRELFLKVWPSSSSLHDGSSQHCFGRNTPAAQPSKMRILTALSIPRTTANKIQFRMMEQLEWCTSDHRPLPSWPWALPKANHFVFTPWLHNNWDESYVWWSSVKLIRELGSDSLLNHCQN
jgi:hypothetical protein